MRTSNILVVVSNILLAAYAAPYGSPPTPCDPLCPLVCSYPFPNDYWLMKDSNYNPINLNLSEQNFPVANLPVAGVTVSPFDWNKLDGFSPIPAILTYWEDLSILNTAPLWNISQSMDPDSPIIILDPVTNKRIEHWTELDHASDTQFTEEKNRTLMIWPYRRLEDGGNYIVAIRYLQTNKGSAIQPSDAFKDLRDNITTNNPAIESRRDRYNEYIFPKLETNGVDRNSLQLAWEFTVSSTKVQTNTMVTMRDDAMNRIKNNNVEYTILQIIENPYDNVARQIKGVMQVPWYLNSRAPGINVRLVRNENDWFGTPQYQDDAEVEFEMLIPQSLGNGTIPNTDSRYLQYGHGLFGSMSEITSGYLREYSNEYGYILAAVDWLGLSWMDVAPVTEILTFNLTDFAMVPDRCHQGMLNALYLMKLLLSPAFIADAKVFQFDNGAINVLSAPYKRNYYGNSQGGILGTVYMALTTDVTHGTLGVPGGPYSLLLPRSEDFVGLFDDIKVRYHLDTDRIMALSQFQLLWNALEPSGYVSHINKNLFPNTPMHSVLFHYSLGDAQVTWLGAEQLAREADCFMYESQVPEYNETLYGFTFIADNVTIDTISNNGIDANKCLIQGWNYNVPQVPFINKPPEGYDTHGYTRKQATAQAANYKFWNEGIIYNPCGGPCNGQTMPITIDDERFVYNNYKKHSDIGLTLKNCTIVPCSNDIDCGDGCDGCNDYYGLCL